MTPNPSHMHLPPHPLESVQHLVLLIVVALFIIAFIAQPFAIPSGSMEPTLRIGDFLLVNKQLISAGSVLPATSIRRGDIIVFHYPVDPSRHLVKRIVALPGDRLRLHNGRVVLNGQPQDEPYAFYRPAPLDPFRDNFPSMQSAEPGVQSRWWVEMRSRVQDGELLVPSGRFFVLGDNRNNSEDSRYWGFVPEQAIVGKPLLIYFSLRPTQRLDDALSASTWQERFIDRLATVARWDRTLQIVR